ncbi:uncharacterized protein TRIADDRAFT_62113 [Trichoplax adhaerens]|uniref:APAF-1 helical domain-containing protein n=1 Tax=Trichoplax adhaerens TaxID=10228 RepID=B3SCV9_TRIAD|nr:predicted protein [Trichoplax adhaerens]EDV19411.1 predicted protein [Trichoplax adhaerens]|eukprot:XP_002118100.1 predicted protein [Trichoplax adhaerens]
MENEDISRLIENCKGLPLAIALIGGQRIATAEGWRNALRRAQQNDANVLPHYRLNLQETFAASIDQLSKTEREQFRKLGVFRKGKIPIDIISSLWELDKDTATRILYNFQDRSLLTVGHDRINAHKFRIICNLHDLIVDYLRLPSQVSQLSYEEHYKELNRDLISRTYFRYRLSWSDFEDDGYFCKNLVEHAISADSITIINKIAMDVEWMDVSLKASQSVSNLLFDLERCQKFLRAQMSYNDYLGDACTLLQEHSSYLQFESVDFVQFLLVTTNKISWLYKEAFKIAEKRRTQGSFYAIVSYTESKHQEKWQKSLRTGNCKEDPVPKCSNSYSERFRIASSKGNDTTYPTLLVTESDNAKHCFSYQLEKVSVINVNISPCGSKLAYCYVPNYNHSERGLNCVWEVINVEDHRKLNFIANDDSINIGLEAYILKFSPYQNSLIVTLSSDKRNLETWIIDDKEVVMQQTIGQSLEIQGFEFIPKGSRILSWHRNNPSSFSEREWNIEKIDTCEIKAHEIENLNDYTLIEVPELIDANTCNAIAKFCQPENICNLDDVKAIDESMIVMNYGSTLGVLPTNFNDSESLRVVEEFSEIFQAISKGAFVAWVAISNDGELIAALVRSGIMSNIQIYQFQDGVMIGNQVIVCSSEIVFMEFIHEAFALVAYNWSTQGIYLYTIKVESPQNTIMYEDMDEKYHIVKSDSAFVNNIPIISKLRIDKEGYSSLSIMTGADLNIEHIYDLRTKKASHQEKASYDYHFHCDMPGIMIEEVYKCWNELCLPTSTVHWHAFITMYELPPGNRRKWTQNLIFTTDIMKSRSECLYNEKNVVFIKWLSKAVLIMRLEI